VKNTIFVLITITVLASICLAEDMNITAKFGIPTVNNEQITVQGAFHRYEVNDWPVMPSRLIIRELPPGIVVTGVETSKDRTCEMDVSIASGTGPRLISDPAAKPPFPSRDTLSSWPEQDIIWSVHGGIDPITLERRSFLVMRLFPAHLTGNNHLTFTRCMHLTVSMSVDSKQLDKRFVTRTNQPFLVIVPESMTTVLNPYLAHKTAQGLIPEVVTIETILQSTPGIDDPQKLRNYIQNRVETSATTFVLLAGDADVLPVRRSQQEDDPLEIHYLPVEGYFSDLYDGAGNSIDWDANADGNFGSYPSDLPAMDFLADVFVSRIPASTPAELTIALDNVIAYETNVLPDADWFNRVLFTAVDIFHDEPSGIPEGERFAEQLIEDPFNNMDVVRLYETDLYPHEGRADSETFVSRASEGTGFLAFHCHGSPDCFWLIDECVSNEDAAALTNSYRLPVMFGFACSTAAFDNELPDWPYSSAFESMPEHFLLSPSGGAVSYVGATRVALASGYGHAQFRTNTGALEYPYFKSWFEGAKTPAMMLAAADLSYTKNTGINSYYDYITLCEYAQFGDPTLAVGGVPPLPELSVTSSLFTSGSDNECTEPGETAALTFTVMNSGTTGENLSVSLTCNDPGISFPVSETSLGLMNRYQKTVLADLFTVIVDAGAENNHLVSIEADFFNDSIPVGHSSIPLFIGSKPCITADEWDIGYDTSYNANIDPGDQIYVQLFLKNIGCETARDLVLTVTSGSSWLDWCKNNSGNVGDIPPGWGAESGWGNIDIGVKETCPHGTEIPLDIILTDTESNSWAFTKTITVNDKLGPDVHDLILSDRSLDPEGNIDFRLAAFDVSGIQQIVAQIQRVSDGSVSELILLDDGHHGDGESDDGIFGGTFRTSNDPGDFFVNIISTDLRNNIRVFSEISAFSTRPINKDGYLLIASSPDPDAGTEILASLSSVSLPTSLWDVQFRGFPEMDQLESFHDSLIIWTFGWKNFPSSDERSLISSYLASGGAVFLSGWDLARNVSRNGGREWLVNTFGAGVEGTNTGDYHVEGVEGDLLFDGWGMRLQKKKGDTTFTPDILSIQADGEERMIFTTNSDASGLITRRGAGFRTAFVPFALEHIRIAAERAEFLEILVPWLADHPADPVVELDLNLDYYHSGDAFVLTAKLINPFSDSLAIREYIALSAGDAIWFWPSWVLYPEEIDFEDSILEPFYQETSAILDFRWPDTTASASGLWFYAILTDPISGTLLSELDSVNFDFGY